MCEHNIIMDLRDIIYQNKVGSRSRRFAEFALTSSYSSYASGGNMFEIFAEFRVLCSVDNGLTCIN